MKKLNIRELSIVMDRTHATIYKWLRKGVPHMIDKYGNIVFDEAEVRSWVMNNIKVKHARKGYMGVFDTEEKK